MNHIINMAKLQGKTENEIYINFLDGKSINVDDFGNTCSNKITDWRVFYFKQLTEEYLKK